MRGSVRIGIDVGGTFTDIIVYSDGKLVSSKVLTDPKEPWMSVLAAIDSLGLSPSQAETIITSTTLGANFLLAGERLAKPRVVLITNSGFEDVLEIGRQNRPSLYDINFIKPPPLVPRELRYGVSGRIDSSGREVEPLDADSIVEIASRECRPDTVFAVSFLHSYINSEHEVIAGSIIRETCPKSDVVLSSDVDPRPGEYERTSTAVVNAYLKPVLARYLERLRAALDARGFRGRLLVMKSDGGLSSPEEVLRAPALFLESGPAAGVVAASYYAAASGIDKVVSFDMGGTTAKAGSVVSGRPLYTDLYEVGGKVHMGRLVRGSGYPVRHTFIDLAEVSSGGGTVIWVDRGGVLRIGPRSSGSYPGPACYGRGGVEPTITDANAALGRLPPSLAGGRIRVVRDLAVKSLEKLSREAGLPGPYEAAESALALANTVMARAIRLVTVERGLDPAEFTLLAFGGAGPLHALELAREVGISEVVVPPYPGVFSALGLLVSDYRVVLVRPVGRVVSELSDDKLEAIYVDMESEAISKLEGMGVEGERIRVVRLVEARYRGQLESISVPYRGLASLRVDFEEAFESRYGFRSTGSPVEVSALRVEALGVTDKPVIRVERRDGEPLVGYTRIYVSGEWVDSPQYDASRLDPGFKLEGPALVMFDDSTFYLPPRCKSRVGDRGEIVAGC